MNSAKTGVANLSLVLGLSDYCAGSKLQLLFNNEEPITLMVACKYIVPGTFLSLLQGDS